MFLTRSEGLPVNLPKATSAQQQAASQPINFTVDAAGKISVNRKSVTLDVLAAQVRTLMGVNQEALVIINADEQVNHGQVVAVMDRLRQIQGAKLAIATQKP